MIYNRFIESQDQEQVLDIQVNKPVQIILPFEDQRSADRPAPRATLTLLSCSPNFPRAQYLDIRTLTHEPIVNLYS